jgi:hypothetical protein
LSHFLIVLNGNHFAALALVALALASSRHPPRK